MLPLIDHLKQRIPIQRSPYSQMSYVNKIFLSFLLAIGFCNGERKHGHDHGHSHGAETDYIKLIAIYSQGLNYLI